MLKLIRKGKNLELGFRKKDTFFTKELLIGFGIALFFHLLLITAFQIDRGDNEELFSLHPTLVVVDNKSLVFPIHPRTPKTDLKIALRKEPAFPKLISSGSFFDDTLSSSLSVEPNFSSLEEIPYSSPIANLEFEKESIR